MERKVYFEGGVVKATGGITGSRSVSFPGLLATVNTVPKPRKKSLTLPVPVLDDKDGFCRVGDGRSRDHGGGDGVATLWSGIMGSLFC